MMKSQLFSKDFAENENYSRKPVHSNSTLSCTGLNDQQLTLVDDLQHHHC